MDLDSAIDGVAERATAAPEGKQRRYTAEGDPYTYLVTADGTTFFYGGPDNQEEPREATGGALAKINERIDSGVLQEKAGPPPADAPEELNTGETTPEDVLSESAPDGTNIPPTDTGEAAAKQEGEDTLAQMFPPKDDEPLTDTLALGDGPSKEDELNDMLAKGNDGAEKVDLNAKDKTDAADRDSKSSELNDTIRKGNKGAKKVNLNGAIDDAADAALAKHAPKGDDDEEDEEDEEKRKARDAAGTK